MSSDDDDGIKPFFLWCMRCQLRCARNYEPKADCPFEIDCCYVADGPICYHQCSCSKTKCEIAAPGMLGNGWDYSQTLRWTAGFWDNREDNKDENNWSELVRSGVASVLNDLNRAFYETVTVYRRKHGLEVDGHDAEMAYCSFVEKRRQLLVHLPCYRSSKLLRLLPGEPGYIMWMVALRVFTEKVENDIIFCAFLRGLDDIEACKMVDKAL
ncbi:hypothetical protein BDV26DRAFT_283382 [Aspergillus bertholletiae]|uniref:Uncharacterized protein n=1 Tax=Aspergillus bertholletiae TaxID=1226010 RepID=A0A5N7B0P8_9EURO|nr:hypothetical protein BDV26DRAFT_283382 [Aspergillus bertholletiae]